MRTPTLADLEFALKMQECQKAAKTLFQAEYPEKMKWYKETISRVMSDRKINAAAAVVFLSQLETVKDNGMMIMLFTAAAVEIMEEGK